MENPFDVMSLSIDNTIVGRMVTIPNMQGGICIDDLKQCVYIKQQGDDESETHVICLGYDEFIKQRNNN